MYVLGTAGHVDHGKSTLVHALTGINPDRLAEEQRREMTIDLGFAHMTLPSGKQVGVVDVPGHERFIKNMLAGVGGIDAALLVVAADEGVMPQTEEHLHILDLLGVTHGVVVLTKCDLVDDDWLQLVQDDVRERLNGTSLAGAPHIAVSARTGAGLDALKRALDALLDHTPTRTGARGTPRLPVDRVFTVGGFGTVVTGTLLDGVLMLGQEIEIQPHGVRGRVRGLQTHGAQQKTALPGTRVAANLAGVVLDQVGRGDVVTLPDALTPSMLLDLKLRAVTDAPQPVKQNDRLDLFVGAAETPCRVTLLNDDRIMPGNEGWVQLRLDRPVAAARGDRCIVRVPSPSVTIGGGVIVDVHPPRHRRFRPDVINALETRQRGTPVDLLRHALGSAPVEWSTAVRHSGLDAQTAHAAWNDLHAQEQVRNLSADAVPDASQWIMSTEGWHTLLATITTTLAAYHKRWPLRVGMSREELRSRLRLPASRAFDAVLRCAHADEQIALNDARVGLPQWTPQLSAVEQQQVDGLLAQLQRDPFMPPPKADWEALGPELLAYLAESGQIVRIVADVLFAADAYAKLVEWTLRTLDTAGDVSVAGLRDHFGTSRKYALAFLEHMDERKLTRRQGDVRVKY